MTERESVCPLCHDQVPRVKELGMQVAEYKKWWDESAQIIRGIQGKCDAQAALVERMRDYLKTYANLENWMDGEWIADCRPWEPAESALALTPASALREFKERCWAEGADAGVRWADVHPIKHGDRLPEIAASIVAELKRSSCPDCKDIGAIQRGPDSKGNHFDPEPCPTCQPTASQTKGKGK